MPTFREIVFKIDDLPPSAIPMARLVKYMADVATILGQEDKVHTVEIRSRSTSLVQLVEEEELPVVMHRVKTSTSKEAEPKVRTASRSLNRRLRIDGTAGRFLDDKENDIIEFPGAKKPAPILYGPLKEPGSIQGEVQGVGGKDETIPVWIRCDTGEIPPHCFTRSKELAKELGARMYEQLRLNGVGIWTREEDADWELKRFEIDTYEELSDEPLLSVVTRLRAAAGSKWAEMHDPLRELERLRYGEDEVQ
jgi:hypothetical protein